MLETGLFQLITTDPTVSALIGTRLDFAKLLKNRTLPAAVMQLITTKEVYSASGANNLRYKRVQFDSYSTDYLQAVSTSDAIRNLLKSKAGFALPDGTFVNGCIVSQDRDMPYEDGATGYVYRRMLEVIIQHTEAA
jgi:hypothetical protein